MTALDGKARLISLTPVLSISTQYAAGDQMGGVLTLTNALDSSSDTGSILSLQVVDTIKQGAAFDILFFNSLPTLTSVDNGALDIADSEMTTKFIGRVSVPEANYTDLANCSDATVLGIGLLVQGLLTQHLYAVLQCQGTPTYTGASNLVVKVGVIQD